jgi:type IV pilus assembly protein PilC
MNSVDLRQFTTQHKSNPPSQMKAVSSLLNKEITLFKKKFDDRKKQIFFMELHSMISSGVNLKNALEIIIAQESDADLKSKFEIIEQRLVEGCSLAEALQLSGLFSSYECVTTKTGEETGRLSEVIKSLSIYYSGRIKQRRQLIAAISYPAVILTFSFVVVIFLMTVMIPMFQSVFSKFNSELPASTKAVFAFSETIRAVWLELVLVSIAALLVYARNRNRRKIKDIKTKIVKHLPFFGAIYRGIAIAGFCKSMAFLISSKVPLNRCIELQRELCTYMPIQNALQSIEDDLINGCMLHESFNRVADFNIKFIAMIRIGEEINQLGKFFDTLAEQYTAEIDFRITQMNALLEPFLIIFLGLVVGFILITMYLPMFEISNSFNQK